MIEPILTEKSFADAKDGFFTFWAGAKMTKEEIRKAVEASFDVHVTSVRTLNYRGGIKKNWKGEEVRIKGRKKAVVTLKADEKIDVFIEKGK